MISREASLMIGGYSRINRFPPLPESAGKRKLFKKILCCRASGSLNEDQGFVRDRSVTIAC
jgi:hypothetical protein